MELRDRLKRMMITFCRDLQERDLEVYLQMASSFEQEELRNKNRDIESARNDSSLSETEKHHYEMHINDIYDAVGSAVDIAHSMALVSLHSRVEIARKKILMYRFPNLSQKNMYRLDYINEKIVPIFSCAAESFHVKELRLINNSIKHSECRVTPELSRHTGAEEGLNIEELGSLYYRLFPSAQAYINNMVDSALEDLKLV